MFLSHIVFCLSHVEDCLGHILMPSSVLTESCCISANYLQIFLYDISSVPSELSWLCFAEFTYRLMYSLFGIVGLLYLCAKCARVQCLIYFTVWYCWFIVSMHKVCMSIMSYLLHCDV